MPDRRAPGASAFSLTSVIASIHVRACHLLWSQELAKRRNPRTATQSTSDVASALHSDAIRPVALAPCLIWNAGLGLRQDASHSVLYGGTEYRHSVRYRADAASMCGPRSAAKHRHTLQCYAALWHPVLFCVVDTLDVAGTMEPSSPQQATSQRSVGHRIEQREQSATPGEATRCEWPRAGSGWSVGRRWRTVI